MKSKSFERFRRGTNGDGVAGVVVWMGESNGAICEIREIWGTVLMK